MQAEAAADEREAGQLQPPRLLKKSRNDKVQMYVASWMRTRARLKVKVIVKAIVVVQLTWASDTPHSQSLILSDEKHIAVPPRFLDRGAASNKDRSIAPPDTPMCLRAIQRQCIPDCQ